MAWKGERDQNILETYKKNIIFIVLYAPNIRKCITEFYLKKKNICQGYTKN